MPGEIRSSECLIEGYEDDSENDDSINSSRIKRLCLPALDINKSDESFFSLIPSENSNFIPTSTFKSSSSQFSLPEPSRGVFDTSASCSIPRVETAGLAAVEKIDKLIGRELEVEEKDIEEDISELIGSTDNEVYSQGLFTLPGDTTDEPSNSDEESVSYPDEIEQNEIEIPKSIWSTTESEQLIEQPENISDVNLGDNSFVPKGREVSKISTFMIQIEKG